MNKTTEVDELRDGILEIIEEIKKYAESIPAVYDAMKLLADTHPDTHHDIHLSQIGSDLDAISTIAERGLRLIREADRSEEELA